MALDTYANLQTAIITWAFRTGDTPFTAAVPDFIALAESRFNRELRLLEQETTATITLTSGTGPLPADYLQYREIKTVADVPVVLSAIAPDYGDQFYPTGATQTPQYFAIVGSDVQTFPPSSNDLTIRYYQKIAALSDAAPTNWLLTKAPELYLYASLMEAMPFMMEDDRLQTWTALYQRAKEDLINADTRARFAKAGVKVRGYTP